MSVATASFKAFFIDYSVVVLQRASLWKPDYDFAQQIFVYQYFTDYLPEEDPAMIYEIPQGRTRRLF